MAGFSPQEALTEVEKWSQRLDAGRERLQTLLNHPLECPREQKSDEENVRSLLELCGKGIKDDEEAQCTWKGLAIALNNIEGRLREDPVAAQKQYQDMWPLMRSGLENACLPTLERYLDKREGKPAMATAVEVARKQEAANGDASLGHAPMLSMKYALMIGAVLVVLVLVVWWFRDSLGKSKTSSDTSVSQSSMVTKQGFGSHPTEYTVR